MWQIASHDKTIYLYATEKSLMKELIHAVYFIVI